MKVFTQEDHRAEIRRLNTLIHPHELPQRHREAIVPIMKRNAVLLKKCLNESLNANELTEVQSVLADISYAMWDEKN